MLQMVRMQTTRLNTTKIQEVWLSQDLQSLHLKFINSDLSDHVEISKVIRKEDVPALGANKVVMAVQKYYPVCYPSQVVRSPKQEARIKEMQEKFIEKYGEAAKQKIDIDTKIRNMSTGLIFVDSHELSKYLQPDNNKPGDDFAKFEKVNFGDRVLSEHKDLLINALNGVELEYEIEEAVISPIDENKED